MLYTRFRHLAFESSKGPPTDAQIADLEALLGAPLPASFREFLAAGNGGGLEYVIDVLHAGRVEAMSFGMIFSTDPTAPENVFDEILAHRAHLGIPVAVLPFARDGGNSIAFLDLTAEGGGRVVAFVQGMPAWTGRPSGPALVEIASSFDHYVDKLRLDREAALDGLERFASVPAHVEATEEWLDIGLPQWREDPELRAAADEARKRVSGV